MEDQRFLAGAFTAAVACEVTALKLASAMSVACLTAFCTDSKAVLAAETAFFITATADSEPAGALAKVLSIRLVNCF